MKRKLWMLAAILTCGLTMSSCVAEKDNPIDSGTDPDTGTTPANYDEFATLPGNEGDPAVVTALKTIENVEDLKPFINVNLGQAYYFNYRQQVDHNDPSKGTFKQQVVLTFVIPMDMPWWEVVVMEKTTTASTPSMLPTCCGHSRNMECLTSLT